MIAALVDNESGPLKKSSVDNRGEDTVRSNPGVGLVDDAALLQFVRNAIEDVVADDTVTGTTVVAVVLAD